MTLDANQIRDEDLADWRSVSETLRARFRTKNFATGLEFVNRIGAAAEAANHHPDLDLRYTHLNIRLFSHDVNAMTERDVDLARRISEIAAELGVAAEPDQVANIEIALDSEDPAAITPFWMAVLGLTEHPRFTGDLHDPNGNLPTLWLQETQRHAEPRQRFHLDVHLPADVAAPRIAAALAAGGVLVSDREAPWFTVLADVQGNKVCVCTDGAASEHRADQS